MSARPDAPRPGLDAPRPGLDAPRPGLDAPRPGLDALLAPRVVAVVGASADPERIGGRPIRYYREAGFAGRLYPVNPNRAEVQGYAAFPSVEAIPEPIDFALLAVPAERLMPSLEACRDRGARAAVIFTAGFAEVGPEGAARQRDLAAFARRAGMRVLGPNCLGLFNGRIGHCPTFSSALQAGLPAGGRVGFVTQSGAYGTHILELARARRIGVDLWISTGNEADVAVADCVAHLADDPEIDVVACYLEGVRDGPAFLAALARARAAGKVVALMKVGASPEGAAAAASHTASLAGGDDVFQAAMDQFGVERCETTDALLDLVYAASRAPRPRGRRLGVLTVSGGAGVLMADAAHRHGLALPPMPDDVQRRLVALNPLASARNPVDVTGHALNDLGLVKTYFEAMLDEGYDMLVGFFTSWPAAPGIAPKLYAALDAARAGRAERPLVLVATGAAEALAPYERAGFLVFEDPSRAVAALAALARCAERLAEPPRSAPEAAYRGPPLPAGRVGEREAKAALTAAGIAVLPERLATTAAEARAAAEALGLPVALKLASPDVAHKTEVGGVELGLATPDAVEAAFGRIMANAARRVPGARVEGALVSPMAGEGVELIVGARVDPVLGPVVLVGLGGVFVEVLRDVVLRLAPVTPAEARAMLEALKGAALLRGARGRPAADLDAAADAVARLSALAAAQAENFASIEINPLLVRAEGRGAVALDALIVPPEDFPQPETPP